MESPTTTTESPAEAAEAAEAPKADIQQSLSLESTKSQIAEITARPPSPMPTPETSGPQSAGPEAAEAEAAKPKPSVKFDDYTDYKGRKFDPRIHRVKADGTPELTKDGKVKLLPPSKRGKVQEAADAVKRIFNKPPTEEELNAAEQATANAQAAAAAQRSKLEASAKRAADSYFATGTLAMGKGFLENHKKRDPEIRALMMEYEMATGKSFDLPPGLALAVGLATDAISQAANVEECAFKNGIFGRFRAGLEDKARKAGKEHAEQKLFGWLPWKKKKREADSATDQSEPKKKPEGKTQTKPESTAPEAGQDQFEIVESQTGTAI